MPTITTLRERQITAVAGILVDLGAVLMPEKIISTGPSDAEYFDAASIERVNADGWSFDLSGPLGNTIWHEGVVLTPAELDRAWALAAEFQQAC